jgi:MFS family permease
MISLAQIRDRIRTMDPQLKLFLVGMGMLGMSGGIFETTFNNFLHDRFDLTADTRGFLEFPRELPGFLTALFAGLLFFAPETWIAGLSALAIGVGMLGLAFWGNNWHAMLCFMTLWSIGSHLVMPVRSSIGMELAQSKAEKGRRLGQIQGIGIAASIVGCLAVWMFMRHLQTGYGAIFFIGGLVSVLGAVALFGMRMPGAHLQRPKFVWNRHYWLYYVLSLLFGARKQVFITFGPWVLVKIFHQQAWIFAQLWIVASILGILFQPALGKAIDRLGERTILMMDGVLTFAVCMGYGFAHHLPSPTAALWLLYACFVGDQLLFGTGMARDTYLSKIALKPEHVAPTLSLGVSINHIVSMSIPAVGGLMWMKYGHSSVFVGAAGIAMLMTLFAGMIRARTSISG